MLDPYGLGPLDWLITGYWDPPEGVYDAALDEFARSNSDRTHGTADAIVSEVTGGLIDSVGGTAFDSGNRDAAASTAGGIITAADFAITGGGKAIAGGIAKVGGGLIKGTAKAAAGAIDAGDAAKAAKALKGARIPKVKEALKRGQHEHKNYRPGPGYTKEARTPSGKRADAANLRRRHVKELKPNNPRAIRRGEKQAQGYAEEFQQEHGGVWTWEVETYDLGA